ncbi:MAG: acyltransferase domain-containing protein, partial [Saccharopolyspora sp.]|uniref:acyltransferase domain-containing protein n=1 Tax=Saccharopolyspora sp. TaxID=33915 RepID=UPI0025FDD591
ARTRDALREQASRLLELVETGAVAPVDVALSTTTSRAALEHRAVLTAAEPADVTEGLRALAADEDPACLIRGVARSEGKAAFLFTGQGSQRIGMGRDLYGRFPVFAEALDEVFAQLDGELDRPLRDVVFAAPDTAEAALLDETAYAQPALFALEVALFRLVESLGARPESLAGHSIGEIAAAHVAGVLSLADACKLVAARGRLMQELPRGGTMIAIQATEDEVRPLLTEQVSVAAVNGPESVVVSGDSGEAAAIAAGFEDAGRKVKRLVVSHAFHSPLMEPMMAEFRRVAEGISYQEAQLPIVSTVEGDADLASAEYWVEHVRRPVRFLDAVRRLENRGVRTFLELGPDGVLCAAVPACRTEADESVAVSLLRGGRDEVDTFAAATGALHARGIPLNWAEFFTGTGAQRVDLPTYAFQRRRFWPKGSGSGDVRSAGLGAAHHPLLAAAVSLADSDGVLLTGRLSVQSHPWLAEHAIRGEVLLPGTAFVELAIRAGDEVGCDAVDELTLAAPLVLPAQGGVQVQVWLGGPDETGRRPLSLYSRPEGDEELPWTQHATGALTGSDADSPAEFAAAWPPAGAQPVALDGHYERLAADGFGYGPAFRGLRAAGGRGV